MSEHGGFTEQASIYDDTDTGSGRSAVRIASVAALGGLLFGYDSAVINGAVAAIQDRFDVAAAPLGFAVASALLGAAAGALTAGGVPPPLRPPFPPKGAPGPFFLPPPVARAGPPPLVPYLRPGLRRPP